MGSKEIEIELSQKNIQLQDLRNRMDSEFLSIKDPLISKIQEWINDEMDNTITENSDRFHQLEPYKLKQLKEEIERISENVSDSLENSFSDKSIWPHWEEKELDFRCIPYEPVLLRKYFL